MILHISEVQSINRYSDYENCLINLNYDQIDVEKTNRWSMIEHLYNQSACISKSTKIGKIEIPKMCRLGSGHMKVMAFAVAGLTGKPHRQCQDRAIFERPTLRSHNMNTSIDGINSRPYSIGSFLGAISRHNFTAVHYLGDSITMQLARFTVCDLIRDGFSVYEVQQKEPIASEEVHRGATTIFDPVTNKNIEFHAQLWQDICVWGPCPNIAHEVLTRVKNTVLPEALRPQTLLVVNAGLHFTPEIDHYAMVVESFAESLLRVAKEVYERDEGSLIAFRETTAQHFSSAPGGYYERQKQDEHAYSSHCCEKHDDAGENAEIMDYRDQIVHDRLTELDPHWHRYILWIKFFRYSREHGDDLHVEQGQRGAIDCTHYLYDPDYTDSLSSTLMQHAETALDEYFRQKPTWPTPAPIAAPTLSFTDANEKV